MTRRLPLFLLPVLSALVANSARADEDDRKARTGVRPPARAHDPGNLQRLPAVAENPTSWGKLREAVQKIWAGRILRRGVTAVYVVDARTGEELFSAHPDRKLNAASNVKLVSTAAALDALGPDWSYETRLYGAAPDADGVSRGDVYLLGQADPTLGPERLGRMARHLAESGVNRIEGAVVIGDDPLRDVVGVARVRVTVTGAARAGVAAGVRIHPSSDLIRVENRTRTIAGRRHRVQISTRVETVEDDEPRVVVTVSGQVPRRSTRNINRTVGMRSSFTAYTLREAIRRAGVEVTGGVRIAAFEDFAAAAGEAGYLPVVLTSSRSRPIANLIGSINKRSLNHLSDRVVMTAGAQVLGGRPSMAKGIALMHDWLERAGIDPDDLVLDTGSGLSYQTQITARQIVRVLRVAGGFAEDAAGGAHPEAYRASLAVGGRDGTLRSRLRGGGLQGNVIGKTGTLTGIIALSGFVQAADSRVLAFAIVTNGHGGGARQGVRREHDQIVGALFGFVRTEARIAAARRGETGDEAEPAPARDVADEGAVATLAAASADDGDGDGDEIEDDAGTAGGGERAESDDGGE